jgi:hypothetical protein
VDGQVESCEKEIQIRVIEAKKNAVRILSMVAVMQSRNATHKTPEKRRVGF